MIDPVIMREVKSYRMNDKTLHNDLRIVWTWFALGPKKLGLKALNRIVYWEIDWKISKTWKVRPKELLIKRLVN